MPQGEPLSTDVTLMAEFEELQVSTAVTLAVTLATVGKLVGLQPKSLFVKDVMMTGALVSIVQVIVCTQVAVLP
jgi:hypothetical protein